MEIQGAGYLYSIAAAAMAFVGFSAIVVILRQTLGTGLSSFQLLIMQLLVEHGFVVVFLSLLPLLLALFDIPHELIWRLCSGVATFVITAWLCRYLLRWDFVGTFSRGRHFFTVTQGILAGAAEGAALVAVTGHRACPLSG